MLFFLCGMIVLQLQKLFSWKMFCYSSCCIVNLIQKFPPGWFDLSRLSVNTPRKAFRKYILLHICVLFPTPNKKIKPYNKLILLCLIYLILGINSIVKKNPKNINVAQDDYSSSWLIVTYTFVIIFSLGNWMHVNLLLKIVPNKYSIFLCLSNAC